MNESPPGPDFATVMADLGMLNTAAAVELSRESVRLQISPTKLALERGLLSADQAEIAQALLEPHTAIPGYELLSLLGQGGMGAVFRARQKSLNRVVALKTVLLNRISGSNSVVRFEQEAVTLARLVHPHIVSAFDFGKQGSKIFLALEFVEGEDAERFIQRRGPLPEAFAWQLVRQAAAGLAHAAELGIVHRDVKPANLLLVDPPAGFPLPKGVPLVKIADFGLALLQSEDETITRLTSANTAMGSPNYMAPEQVSGDNVDLRADIYALGATAYHFLAGEPPFAGQKLQAIIGQKLSTGPKPLSSLRAGLSSEALELVAQMMALKSEDRQQNYAQLLDQLDRWTIPSGSGPLPADWARSAALAAEQTLELPATDSKLKAGEQTVPFSAASNLPTSTSTFDRRRWIGTATAVLAVLVFGFIGWQAWRSYFQPPLFRYEPMRYQPEIPLFRGGSVAGFTDLRGEWRPATDQEGGIVLAGNRGTATRILPRDLFPQAMNDWQYRVTMIVNRNQAQATHLDFAISQANENVFHRVSIVAGEVQVAAANGRAYAGTQPVKIRDDQQEIALQIVRHPSGWLVLVNEEPAFQLPAVPRELADRFRLATDGGPAWFSDLLVAPWQSG